MIRHYLFVCGKNRRLSPTAENIFANLQGIEVMSAGIRRDADEQVTAELVDWADIIFVMEKRQQAFVRSNFRKELSGTRVVILGIPDRFGFMDDELINILRTKLCKFLT